MPRPELSIVIPIHDAEEALPRVDERLREMLDRHGLDCEVLFVEDGSSDRSLETLRGFVAREGRYRAIVLSRRFGADRAITCGIDAARGKAVIVMDGSLDDPPDVVLDLVAKWREGFDVVHARRRRTGPPPLPERAIAKAFASMSSLDVSLDGGDFVLMSRRVVKAMRRLRETHRFVRGVVAWVGFRQTTIEYDAPRLVAPSLGKTLAAAFDALASSSIVPLRLGTYLGLFVGLCGGLCALAALVTWVAGGLVPAWASTVVLVTLLSSVQLLVLGLLGEYVGRSYEQSKGRPIYMVAEKLGFAVRRRLATEDFGSIGEVQRKTDRPMVGAPPPAAPELPPPAAPPSAPDSLADALLPDVAPDAASAPSVPPPLPPRASARPPASAPSSKPISSSKPASSKPASSSKATKPPPPLPSAKK